MALDILSMPIALISDELNLIRAFNQKQEQLIEEFITDINNHIGTMEGQIYAGDTGELIAVDIDHIAGVTEEEYDIRALFSENMPMYQRQSMLLTMWAMFEYELERSFLVLSTTLGANDVLPKKPREISKFRHILNQFEKLDCLLDCSEGFNRYVTVLDNEVRIIRNAWAHNGGIDTKEKIPDSVSGITKIHSQICISKEYIEHAWKMFSTVSNDVISSITNRIKAAKAP